MSKPDDSLQNKSDKPGFQEPYFDLADAKFKEIAKNLQSRRKDKVLNIRINSDDLEKLKAKASSLGVKYQTFISEILHQAATASVQQSSNS